MPILQKSTFVLVFALATSSAFPQAPARPAPANFAESAKHATALAEAGQCPKALPLLSKAVAHVSDKELQKRVAVDGVRCASALGQPDQVLEFTKVLNRDFSTDPEALYVLIHAYSDLSTKATQDLARIAPSSIPALELDAETNEMQGKWDVAETDYRKILEQNPKYPGIHFRLARIQLSRPNPPPDFREVARKELLQELEIDPTNAGAEYILGELARQSGDLPEAIDRFTQATKLDHGFADAYLGLGSLLLTQKKYADAIPPLEMVVKLQPANPLGHYDLATAYARSGRKEDAEREFAVHKEMTEAGAGPGVRTPQP
ncbi:MAG TPA: tetratricopeptide repeat protein [Terriglobales bacterium]